MWVPCTPASNTTRPIASATSDTVPAPMSTIESAVNSRVAPTVQCAKPRSASLPAPRAASAPATPNSENSPITPSDRLCGGRASRKPMLVHTAPNAA